MHRLKFGYYYIISINEINKYLCFIIFKNKIFYRLLQTTNIFKGIEDDPDPKSN